MNFDVSAEVRNKSPVEQEDISTAIQHLVANHDVTHVNEPYGSDEHIHKNSTLADSLLLPTPMNRPKSTSVLIAEKSNIWSEHKLQEKTTQLDKELYHAMLKMNASRLEVVNDLAKLKRSISAGSLRKLHDESNHKTSRDKAGSKTDSLVIERRAHRKEAISPTTSKPLKSESDSLIKKSERASGIEIRITSDLSSDEEEVSDHVHLRAVSSPIRRHCREERSQGEMVENVLRRYAKQTSPKPVFNSKR